jgi:TRAP-type C4-dicarboxylate transport system substrate-binding protein
MSKKWMDTLPPDLQKIIDDDGDKVTQEITPYVKDFFNEQAKIYVQQGGKLSELPKDEADALAKKVNTIGDDMSKSKPALNEAVKLMFAAVAKHK